MPDQDDELPFGLYERLVTAGLKARLLRFDPAAARIVTQELDAMAVMGIPHTLRLILPKMLALAVSMPLIVLWTNAIALIGGMVSAEAQLGISYTYFLSSLPSSVPIANLWLGLGKGVVFGFLIALVACHFGLRIEPNTESLGIGTTNSVVTSITVVIIVDAVFAIMFKDIGIM